MHYDIYLLRGGGALIRAALSALLHVFVIEELVKGVAARLVAVEVVDVAVVCACVSDAEHLRHGAAIYLATRLTVRVEGVVYEIGILAISRHTAELPRGGKTRGLVQDGVRSVVMGIMPLASCLTINAFLDLLLDTSARVLKHCVHLARCVHRAP